MYWLRMTAWGMAAQSRSATLKVAKKDGEVSSQALTHGPRSVRGDALDVRSDLVPCLLVGRSNDLSSHRPEGSLLLERHLRSVKAKEGKAKVSSSSTRAQALSHDKDDERTLTGMVMMHW